MSHAPDSAFDPVEEVIAEIAAGRLVIVTDDEDRENEGDLIMAAAKATPEALSARSILSAKGLYGFLALTVNGASMAAIDTTLLGLNPQAASSRTGSRSSARIRRHRRC